MKNIWLVALLTILGFTVSGQYISSVTKPDSNATYINDTTDIAYKFAQTITPEEMKAHLSIIASDTFQGRETGEPGIEMARDYLVDELKKLSREDGYKFTPQLQDVDFTFSSWEDMEIFVNGERYRHMWDFLAFPNRNNNNIASIGEEVIFMGYGIEDNRYNEYKKADVAGKIIMINKGEPYKKDSTSYITKTSTPSEWTTDISKKLRLAKEKGVELVLIIEDDIKGMLSENRRFLLGPTVELGDKSNDTIDLANHVYISSTIAKQIIGSQEKKVLKARKKIRKRGKFKPVTLPTNIVVNQVKKQRVLSGQNILAYLPGKYNNEAVIISAHYDHIGMRGESIFNGADDNGSGTTTVLEILEAFVEARKAGHLQDRPVIFMWVTGEEKGLLGSRYYVNNPIYSLNKAMVDINIDMVGRVDKKYAESGDDYVYVIGSDRLSTDLHKLNEEVNQQYSGLTLDYTYNSEDDPNRYYYRSDHYNFAKNGIPAIFFFNGVHEDYHRASDTVDKINFDMMSKRGQHIFKLAWKLSNLRTKLKVDGEVK